MNRGCERAMSEPANNLVVDRTVAKHFNWAGNCDGWPYVATSQLSVIEERMPPGTTDVLHHHRAATQFFYVLRGQLCVEVDGVARNLDAGQGIEIAPGSKHLVCNRTSANVDFLVISVPPTNADRVLEAK